MINKIKYIFIHCPLDNLEYISKIRSNDDNINVEKYVRLHRRVNVKCG